MRRISSCRIRSRRAPWRALRSREPHASPSPATTGFGGGSHGRPFGALSAPGSNLNSRPGHEPLLPDVHLVPYPHAYRDHGGDEGSATEAALAALDRLLGEVVAPDSVAAVLIE